MDENQKQELIEGIRIFGVYDDDLRGLDLSNSNLEAASLVRCDLRGANLSGANLWGASLNGTDLRSANLQGATLDQVILNHCQIDETTQIDDKWRLVWEIVNFGAGQRDLRGSDFSTAKLGKVDFSGVDLREANFTESNLFEANLSDADLRGAILLNISGLLSFDLHGTKIDAMTQMDDRIQLVWEIVNQEASGRNLSQVNLSETNLKSAKLSGANLRDAWLRGTKLQDASLRGADLSKADISGAELQNADLRDANFSEAKLRANLCGADLRGANLSGVDWFNAKYDRSTQWPEGFDPAQFGLILIETGDP